MIWNKKGKADFEFLAKNPPSLLIAGGILIYLIGNDTFGIFLILLGVILQIVWLFKDRF